METSIDNMNESNQSIELTPPILGANNNTAATRFLNLEKKIEDLIKVVSLLDKKNFMLENLVSDLAKKNDENEKYIRSQDVYSRRNNVEFCNIPENVSDDRLEEHIIKILKSINVDINSYDIVAVHRIGKKLNNRSRNVIIRFVNRKDAYRCLKLRYRLKNSTSYKRIFITENLCPTNKRIFNALYKLKKSEVIHAVWSYNGNIFYKIDETDEHQNAECLDDILYLFDNTVEDNDQNINQNNEASQES